MLWEKKVGFSLQNGSKKKEKGELWSPAVTFLHYRFGMAANSLRYEISDNDKTGKLWTHSSYY